MPTLIDLTAELHVGQIFCGHDVCLKMQMTGYGGYGYGNLLDAVSEAFKQLTGSRDLLMQFGVENTRHVLCCDTTPAEVDGKGSFSCQSLCCGTRLYWMRPRGP